MLSFYFGCIHQYHFNWYTLMGSSWRSGYQTALQISVTTAVWSPRTSAACRSTWTIAQTDDCIESAEINTPGWYQRWGYNLQRKGIITDRWQPFNIGWTHLIIAKNLWNRCQLMILKTWMERHGFMMSGNSYNNWTEGIIEISNNKESDVMSSPSGTYLNRISINFSFQEYLTLNY